MPFPRSGTFRSGTFRSGTFHSGTFRSGTFRSGIFCPGAFRPGTFCPGTFCPGTFCPGIFCPGIFCPGAFCPGAFRPGTFPPRLFVLLRPFCPACLPPPGGMFVRERRRSSGWEIARSLWEGKTLGRKKRGARWERGGPLVREGKAIWSEGRGTSSGAGRLGRRGGHPVAGGPLRGAFPAERVSAEPEVEAR